MLGIGIEIYVVTSVVMGARGTAAVTALLVALLVVVETPRGASVKLKYNPDPARSP